MKKISVTWILYEIQISVSINEVVLEHNMLVCLCIVYRYFQKEWQNREETTELKIFAIWIFFLIYLCIWLCQVLVAARRI